MCSGDGDWEGACARATLSVPPATTAVVSNHLRCSVRTAMLNAAVLTPQVLGAMRGGDPLVKLPWSGTKVRRGICPSVHHVREE